jgi:hypothetical protein
VPSCEIWPFDTDCCELPDGTSEELIEQKTAEASAILWAAGGRRHGLCEVTVRPCLRSCFGGWPIASPFYPYKDGEGQWHNLTSCGCLEACSCTALSEVVLQGPVADIVSVEIDGETLDESDYRLDIVNGQYRLLRIDGGVWPSCSDITAECGTIGAFCVTYMQGIALDELAAAASSELVCNLLRACLNLPCLIPANVAAITRRGVAITFESAKSWIMALPAVAAWIESVNPDGLTSSPTVWSPDLPPHRVTVAPTGS